MPERYHIQALTTKEAHDFCERWLPAWTGNKPSRLASFYTDDLHYADPSIPGGVSGKEQFIRYLQKLLGNNPNWVWQHQEAIPLENGFLNKWACRPRSVAPRSYARASVSSSCATA